MPHFMIVLIPYINLLNLSCIKQSPVLRGHMCRFLKSQTGVNILYIKQAPVKQPFFGFPIGACLIHVLLYLSCLN